LNIFIDGRVRNCRTVTFDAGRNAVQLIDQRRLPHRFQIVSTADYRATARAIGEMVVRGAGAIGATAAYGLAQGARAFRGKDPGKFSARLEAVYQTIEAARPTAVDPVNAMKAVLRAMRAGTTVEERQALALAAA
jgi:methylthioribose-1-phosphate isomerase